MKAHVQVEFPFESGVLATTSMQSAALTITRSTRRLTGKRAFIALVFDSDGSVVPGTHSEYPNILPDTLYGDDYAKGVDISDTGVATFRFRPLVHSSSFAGRLFKLRVTIQEDVEKHTFFSEKFRTISKPSRKRKQNEQETLLQASSPLLQLPPPPPSPHSTSDDTLSELDLDGLDVRSLFESTNADICTWARSSPCADSSICAWTEFKRLQTELCQNMTVLQQTHDLLISQQRKVVLLYEDMQAKFNVLNRNMESSSPPLLLSSV